ncbi:hypothetical protein MRX96_057811 [Rhipicephalus microplus]
MKQRLSSVFFLTDQNSIFHSPVNTGTVVGVLPASPEDRKRPNTSPLQAVRTSAAMYGSRVVTNSSSLPIPWIFTVADVKFHIFGADIRYHLVLLVNARNRRLQDPVSQRDVKG